MRLLYKLLIGLLIGFVSVALGITALVTPAWIRVGPNNYGLLLNGLQNNYSGTSLDVIKALNISGVAVILVAVIFAVVTIGFINVQLLRIASLIFLIPGPILNFLGLVLCINKSGTTGSESVTIGYSLILMIASSILGFLVAIYFAFVIGSSNRNSTDGGRFLRETSSPKSVRF